MAQLVFSEADHTYSIDGQALPSVTTITRFCSYDSINGNGSNPFYRERGTKVHELCADYDFIGEFPQGSGVDGYLRAYADFKRDYRIRDWEQVEYALGSLELGFAGTIDRLGYIDGKLSILDIKTSSKLNLMALSAQLTAYAMLVGEPVELYGLQLTKQGKYRLVSVESDMELFRACQTLHNKGVRREDKK